VKTASMTAGTCAGEVDMLTLRVPVAALEELAAGLAKQLEKVKGTVPVGALPPRRPAQ